jgi:hypothetical protein
MRPQARKKVRRCSCSEIGFGVWAVEQRATRRRVPVDRRVRSYGRSRGLGWEERLWITNNGRAIAGRCLVLPRGDDGI